MSNKLFVGGLNWTTSEDALRAAFEAHGEVSEIKIITDRETGRSRGFGFVTYADDPSAEKARDAMNGGDLDGHTLHVDVAQERNHGGGRNDR